jgi:hypothetical protein
MKKAMVIQGSGQRYCALPICGLRRGSGGQLAACI